MKTVNYSLLLITFVLVSFGSLAMGANGDSTILNALEDNVLSDVPVDGATNPEQVPHYVKYSMFVSLYERVFRNILVQKLSPNDDAILNNLAIHEESKTAIDSLQYNNDLLTLCAFRDKYSPEALARESERIALQANQRRSDRYRQAIDSLSPEGKELVENFVQSEVAYRIKTTIPNTENYAKAHPEDFLAEFEVTCYVAENGDLPPDIKEVIKQRADVAERNKNFTAN